MTSRSPEISRDRLRSPEIARDRPRSPEMAVSAFLRGLAVSKSVVSNSQSFPVTRARRQPASRVKRVFCSV